MRLRLFALAVFMVLAVPAVAATDELARLNAQILNDPTNIELNLRYAQLAEERGEPRKALAAYERVLTYDPSNAEAQKGLDRVRAHILPPVTEITTEIGANWQSNPHQVPTGAKNDEDFFARLSIRDERTLADTRWRTTGLFVGDLYASSSDLTYAYGSGAVGPVYSAGPYFTMHPAVGGAVSYFDHHLFYSEGFASALFEGAYNGVTQTYLFRGGYRDFDSAFPASHGPFADFVVRFSKPEVFNSGDLFVLSPWVRWSGVGGTFAVNTPVFFIGDNVQIGRYIEGGARAEYFQTLTDWLVGSLYYSYIQRDFARSTLTTGGTLSRRDAISAPGASLTFRNVLNLPGALRLDYRYERDDSNDFQSSYTNNVVTLTYARRW